MQVRRGRIRQVRYSLKKILLLSLSSHIIILVWLTVPIELFPGHFHIFVGDLSSEVNDATLYACFSAYPSCS